MSVRSLALLAVCALALDCGPGLGLTQSVYVDDSFTPAEFNAVYEGFERWESAFPGVVSFAIVPAHASDIVHRVGHGDDVLYVVRGRNECPVAMPSNAAGIFWGHYELGQRVNGLICFDDVAINGLEISQAVKDPWLKTAMHEIGHALGLNHTTAPSVMTQYINDVADDVTCKDRNDLAALWALPQPQCT